MVYPYIHIHTIECCTCQMYKRGLVYPHYGWIIYGWYPDKWWTEEVAGEHLDECTDQQLEEFLRMSQALFIDNIPEPDNYDLPTVAGYVC